MIIYQHTPYAIPRKLIYEVVLQNTQLRRWVIIRHKIGTEIFKLMFVIQE